MAMNLKLNTMWLWLVLTAVAPAAGQETPDRVVAIVGEHKIFLSQIDHEYHRKFAQRDVGDELETRLRSRILQRLIDQSLVLARFRDTEIRATADEIDLELSRMREELALTERTLEAFLVENRCSMNGLRFNLDWQISWKRYLDQSLTDEVLQKYFARHRRQFDGTQLRVSHCLLAVDDSLPTSETTTLELAQELRKQITSGADTFENIVATHSTTPSKKRQGDLGWISFEGPMSRGFTQAAWQLQKDQISPPTRTSHGVHLIKCIDIREGVKPWYDVKQPLRKAAAEELFRRISEKQKTMLDIQRITQ
ncbi:MAG: hypothetical protein GY743_22850 [Planctomycetaceae bacterium]|nr:hypothetical protein [Planctomycetaceae bacterium]